MRRGLTNRLTHLAAVAAVLGAAACAGIVTSTPPAGLVDEQVRIESRRVLLGPAGATLAPGVGFAGGVVLRGPVTHGLSDLKIADGRAWTVSDFGDLVGFDLRLDRAGRLVGVDGATRRRLAGPDGRPLTDKAAADAEGLAFLAGGEMLVSFEGDHRIWSYGALSRGSGAAHAPTPRPAPGPDIDADFAANAGMEGLAVDGDGDGWLVLGEAGGAWTCDAAGCASLSDPMPAPEAGWAFTGADRDPLGDGWFVVERWFQPPLGVRARVRRLSPDGRLSAPIIDLRPPSSVDNMEGIAAVATPEGVRLYLLSDDNANPLQRTLLLAFDVQ